jgi:hypothetical protein
MFESQAYLARSLCYNAMNSNDGIKNRKGYEYK